jgi:hypothetical protein
MKQFSTTLLVIALGSPAVAQLSVMDSLSASFITDLLEGQNLTISNLTVNCPPSAMGHFSGTSEVPISQGLVLTSGTADAILGPVSNFASGGAMGPGDLDLNVELGGMYPTYDACVLEFDCVPIGDTLLFNFAFGSEEYPEFVGSSFNDVFAIYLSGPGYQPQQNVAALPDGTPVAINNVNAGLNEQYFVDNEAQGGLYVAYDGFTTNLTAFAVVVPGESYHFKTAIADAGDGVFDSGVMLEAFSFRSMGGLSTGLNNATGQPAPRARVRDGLLELAFFDHLQGANAMILDAMGRVVRSFRIVGSSMNVEVGSFATGSYSLRVDATDGPIVRRFTKD